MKKSELIKEIHKDLKSEGIVVHLDQSKKIFDIVFDNISNELAKGKRVTIPNFGYFNTKLMTKNTFVIGQKIRVWVLTFNTATFLKNKINER